VSHSTFSSALLLSLPLPLLHHLPLHLHPSDELLLPPIPKRHRHSTNPTNPTNPLTRPQERKYFDSGDYALSKAGKAQDVTSIGSRHPVPENIPHLTATSPGTNPAPQTNGSISAQGGQQIPGSISGHPGSVGFQRASPKEGGFLHRGSSLSEGSGPQDQEKDESVSPPAAREGVPIQR
jgi:hypothetical protein